MNKIIVTVNKYTRAKKEIIDLSPNQSHVKNGVHIACLIYS